MGDDWKSTGIAWSTDLDENFKFANFSDPALGGVYSNVGFQGKVLPRVDNEEFVVWMRTAALPTFRKLHRIIDTASFSAGTILQFSVVQNFPTTAFGGEKSVVLSTTTWLGAKNAFLGWAFIVVASLSILLGVLFAIKQTVAPRYL